MKLTGNLTQVTKDWKTGKFNLVFTINEDVEQAINEISDKKLSLLIKKYSEKRSLDSNAYFHVLVAKIAEKLNISKTRAKNEMICSYGQPEYLEENKPAVLKTNIPVEKMQEQEFLHCKPCGCKIENGSEVIFYKVFRGSHTYDKTEMSILIKGTVEDAKILGIETLTPAEIEKMNALWRPRKEPS